MTLTYDKFIDSVWPLQGLGMALAPRFIPSDMVPPERRPYCRITIAHPWIVWLSRFTKISPWIWVEDEIVEHNKVYRYGNDFYLHTSMYAALKRDTGIVITDCTA